MKKIQFCRVEGSLRGIVKQAVTEFQHYLPYPSEDFHWVSIDQPEMMAHALEYLSVDLPEEDMADLVRKMPYLFLLFRHTRRGKNRMHVESLLAFLASLGQAGLFNVMRGITDQESLPAMFDLDGTQWQPHVFIISGKVDLHYYHNEGPQIPQLSFFGDEGRLF